jgi:hypothetical protein
LIIRPTDLANVCAIFRELGKNKIGEKALILGIRNTLSIEITAGPKDIINEANRLGLIYFHDGHFHTTKLGQEIGKKQNSVSIRITENTRSLLINRVFLDPSKPSINCAPFVMKLRPDVELGTFVFDREESESNADRNWLFLLNNLDVIRFAGEKPYINREFLDTINSILAAVRGDQKELFSDDSRERKEIGAFTEQLAIKYETNRFQLHKMEYLIPLIKYIAKIDQTAGYDIASCRCQGKNPEKRILIEVKGTRSSKVQFIWSRNERRMAALHKTDYWIYCFTEVNIKKRTAKGPLIIINPINRIKWPEFRLDPIDVYIEKKESSSL